MEANKFNDILSSVAEMNINQVDALFNKILDKKGILIVCASYREDFDNTLEDNGKDKLSDDEWNKFCDKMCPDYNRSVDSMMNMNNEIRNEVMDEIRPNWYNEEETDEDE